MKKVVIISSSLRKESNSEILAKAFEKGAVTAGNQVEMLCLRDLDIQFCKGCLACQKLGHCAIPDGASAVMERIRTADVLVFASPVYYYSICGQLKTFLDRMNPIYAVGHQFEKVYLLSAAADTEEEAVEGSQKDIQGWVDCFEGVVLAGTIFAGGVSEAGSVKAMSQKVQEAYDAGYQV